MTKITPRQAEVLTMMYEMHPVGAAFHDRSGKTVYSQLFNKGLVYCYYGPAKSCMITDDGAVEAFLTPDGAQAALDILPKGTKSKLRSVGSMFRQRLGEVGEDRPGNTKRLVTAKKKGSTILVQVQHPSGNIDFYEYEDREYRKNGYAVAKKSDLPKYIQAAFDKARRKSGSGSKSKSKSKRSKEVGSRADLIRVLKAKTGIDDAAANSGIADIVEDAAEAYAEGEVTKAEAVNEAAEATGLPKSFVREYISANQSPGRISGRRRMKPRRIKTYPRTDAEGRYIELSDYKEDRRLLGELFDAEGRAFGKLTNDEAFLLALAVEDADPRRRPEMQSYLAVLSDENSAITTKNETLDTSRMDKASLRALRGLMRLGLVEIDRINKRTKRGYSRPEPDTSVVRPSPLGFIFADAYLPSAIADAGRGGGPARRGRPGYVKSSRGFRGEDGGKKEREYRNMRARERRRSRKAQAARQSNPAEETVMVSSDQIHRALGTVPTSRGVRYGNCTVSHVNGGLYRISGGTKREQIACKAEIEMA